MSNIVDTIGGWFTGGSVGGSSLAPSMTTLPPYIEEAHTELVDGMLDIVRNEVMVSSPYETAEIYDPTEDLDAVNASLGEFNTALDGARNDLVWDVANGPLAEAIEAADSILSSSDADIDAATDAFEGKQAATLARSSARLAAGYNDIGGINGSAYWIGLALLESEHDAQVASFRASQLVARNELRARLVPTLVEASVNFILKKLDMYRIALAAAEEYAKLKITAETEYLSRQLSMAVDAAKWGLDCLHDGGSILGTIGGIATTKPAPTVGSSALSGALSTLSAVAPIAMQLGPSAGIPLAIVSTLLGGGAAANQTQQYYR